MLISMVWFRRRLVTAGGLLALLGTILLVPPGVRASTADDAHEGLRVGAASVSITPEPGTPMAGYYALRAAEGVHDDLYAKAIVIESNGIRAALVALDLVTTTRPIVEEAREQIDEQTGVPGAHVMISATHTHTGPTLVNDSAREDALGGRSELAVAYRKALPGRIAEAVRIAEQNLRPARIRLARGSESSIAFNRRFHMHDGSVGWNPGKLNPEILKPAGTIDPDVPIVFVESLDGAPIATYVNYAVHLDNVGGPFFSADLPYTLSRMLAEFKGEDMVTLFTAGCCGDINHIDVAWPEPQKGFDNAARMGIILAAEVLRAWPRLDDVEETTLRVARRTIELPIPEVTPAEVAEAEEVAERFEGRTESRLAFLEIVNAYKVLDVEARRGRPLEVEVQVIALGDEVAWVSLPGEVFVELGLEIKRDSPFKYTILAELANGSIGYIPARRAYKQGNYEVVTARCAQGSGERLVDGAVALLKELHIEATQDKE